MALPYDPTTDPHDANGGAARWRRGRAIALGTALLLAALAAAAAATARPFGPWGHHGPGDPEAMREHAAVRIQRMLSEVDATPAQIERAQAIADAAISDLAEIGGAPGEMHDQFVALLSAEEIDRAALERLRAEKVARFDAASRRMTAALADVGEVLTPAQRAALAEHMAERREQRRGRYGRHGGRGCDHGGEGEESAPE